MVTTRTAAIEISVNMDAFARSLKNVNIAMSRLLELEGVKALIRAEADVPEVINPRATPWIIGWTPFCDWLESHGFASRDVYSVEAWSPTWTVCTFTVIDRHPETDVPILDRDPWTLERIVSTTEHHVLMWGERPPYRTPSGRYIPSSAWEH